MRARYFEDLAIGDEFKTHISEPVTRTMVEAYVRLTGDRFSIHCDDAFARACGLRAAMVPGNLLVALGTGAVYTHGHLRESLFVQARKTATFRRPLYVDERFIVTDRIVALHERPDRPYGRVVIERTIVNESGELLVEIEQDYRVLREGAAAAICARTHTAERAG